MTLRSHLRQVENQPPLLLALLRQYPGNHIVSLSSQRRFLSLRLRSTQNLCAQALLDVDLWLDKMTEQLPELPWQEVPLSYLLSWLRKQSLHFWVDEQRWEVISIGPSLTPLPEKSLLLAAEPCALHCLDWPAPTQRRHNRGIIQKIPFQLRFVLGTSRVAVSELKEVVTGDLLLIHGSVSYLAVGERRLYGFRYLSNKEEVVVEHPFTEQEETYRQDESSLGSWDSLPVEIEFVLDSQTVSIADLDEISMGTRLTLPPDIEQKIKIFINKKLFARGELVSLENGPLAVEVNYLHQNLMSERKSDR